MRVRVTDTGRYGLFSGMVLVAVHNIMKILHVITGLDVGGAETSLYQVATGMDPVRFRSRAVSLIEPGVMGDRLTRAGIPVDSLRMRRGVPSPPDCCGWYV